MKKRQFKTKEENEGCLKCAEHSAEECDTTQIRRYHCVENHPASDKSCKVYEKQKMIKKLWFMKIYHSMMQEKK